MHMCDNNTIQEIKMVKKRHPEVINENSILCHLTKLLLESRLYKTLLKK